MVVRMWLKGCIVLLALLGGVNSVVAQDNVDPLSGYWKQEGASVYIQIINNDGVYQAEMIRNDWSPGLVGSMYFENASLSEKKKNRWEGQTSVTGVSRLGKATLRLRSSGKLSTRLKPGGRATWLRSEPVEKRY